MDPTPQIAMFRLATAYYYSCAIYAIAKLGIADLIAQGTTHFEGLAARTGSNSGALRRVMRLLVTAGVFTEDPSGNFALTELGECLRSMRSALMLFGGETQKAWIDLPICIQTGQSAFGSDPFA